MLDIAKDISSLTDFKRNTNKHLESLKKTGRPEVLTVNGHPEVIVQDVKSYQQLLKKADFVDAISAIREGLDSHERGEGIDMRKGLESIAKKHGIKLKR